MSKSWRGIIFLAASFLSSLGDIILVTAIPYGFGFETGNIQFSVIAWLIPAIAVFGASFLSHSISRRHDSARTDYANMLFALAVIEISVAVGALYFTDQTSALILVILFLLGYAFIKEGIPRLLYQVTMYRFFADEHQYKHLVGWKSALDVLAMLSGMLIASQLVSQGTWRFALLLDAVTFVIFGVALYWAGRDYVTAPKPAIFTSSARTDAHKHLDLNSLKWILITVPFLHALNALFPNYFPLISQELGFFDVGTSIVAIALIRFPGVLCGVFYGRIQEWVAPGLWVRLIPALYLTTGAAFLALPSAETMGAMVFFSGLNAGLYSPSDILVRNQLSGHDLVHFNKLVLRWLAVFQFTACVLAMWLYAETGFNRTAIAVALVGFALLAAMVAKYHAKTLVRWNR